MLEEPRLMNPPDWIRLSDWICSVVRVAPLWRIKGEDDILAFMPPRSCRVTIQDLDNVEHTVQVTASSLFEAIALAIASLRAKEWVAGIPEGLNPVRVAVTDIPAEHSVKMKEFLRWLHRSGGSPKEVTQRQRVREILGLPAS